MVFFLLWATWLLADDLKKQELNRSEFDLIIVKSICTLFSISRFVSFLKIHEMLGFHSNYTTSISTADFEAY